MLPEPGFNVAGVSAGLRSLLMIFVCAITVAIPETSYARWYQVEVIAFRHADSSNQSDEIFDELSALPNFRQAVDLIYPMPGLEDEPEPAAAASDDLPTAFEALAESDTRLRSVRRRLSRSERYDVLLAESWRQPSYGVRRARKVYLSNVNAEQAAAQVKALTSPVAPSVVTADVDVEIPSLDIEGTVSIRVSRLLHVAVDFLYYRDGTPIQLTETRRVKLRETHYFDHPLFGLIVQVSPYVLPSATPEEDNANPPADEG